MMYGSANGTSASPSARLSDRELLARVRKRQPAALGTLYDRYAPLVYTIANQAEPDYAEVITEQVFVNLWQAGTSRVLPTPLLDTVLYLTSSVITRHRMAQGSTLEPTSPLMAALASFAGLEHPAFDVAVMSIIGQLKVAEVAVALEQDPVAVKNLLSGAISRLRAARRVGRERSVGEWPSDSSSHAGWSDQRL
jgi:hypothetical protein